MDTLTAKFKEFREKKGQPEGREAVDRALAEHLRTPEAKRSLGTSRRNRWRFVCKHVVCPVLLAATVTFMVYPEFAPHYIIQDYFQSSECLIDNNMFFSEIGRPLFDCHICEDLHEAPVLRDISREEFLRKYAYSSIPVLVKDATHNWTAMNTFSFHYFRQIYSEARKNVDYRQQGEDQPETDECQFFPYKTEFQSLQEALSMSDERASYQPGQKPWYFGWSNCNPHVSEKLRKHYERPYFLPSDSESSSIDWMFMGGHGLGAFMHLDNVVRPSWQAQITGKKTWTVQPPPECEHVCHTFNITVDKGDIIVIDTNQWFHATYVHPGDLSITIGSEYD